MAIVGALQLGGWASLYLNSIMSNGDLSDHKQLNPAQVAVAAIHDYPVDCIPGTNLATQTDSTGPLQRMFFSYKSVVSPHHITHFRAAG